MHMKLSTAGFIPTERNLTIVFGYELAETPRDTWASEIDRSDRFNCRGRGDSSLKIKVTSRPHIPISVFERQAAKNRVPHKRACLRPALQKDQPFYASCNYLGTVHVFATERDVGDLMGRPAKVPLARSVESARRILNEVAGIRFIGRCLDGTEFDQMVPLVGEPLPSK